MHTHPTFTRMHLRTGGFEAAEFLAATAPAEVAGYGGGDFGGADFGGEFGGGFAQVPEPVVPPQQAPPLAPGTRPHGVQSLLNPGL